MTTPKVTRGKKFSVGNNWHSTSTNKRGHSNVKAKSRRSLRKTQRQETKKRTKEEFEAFMSERTRREALGLILCQHGAEEQCNEEADYVHRTHDSDNHEILVCEGHWCEVCVPIDGRKTMEKRLKHINPPLNTKYLNEFIDGVERKPADAGAFDVSLYGMAREILDLRKAVMELGHEARKWARPNELRYVDAAEQVALRYDQIASNRRSA